MKFFSCGSLLTLLAVPIGLASGQTCEPDGNGNFYADYSTEGGCTSSPQYQGNPKDCSFFIYNEADCLAAAQAQGLKLGGSEGAPQGTGVTFAGNYNQKGCYVYNEEGGANKDYVYFGTEGTDEQMECQEEPCLPSNVDRMFKTTLSLSCENCVTSEEHIYNEADCLAAAQAQGLKLGGSEGAPQGTGVTFAGNYNQKGCYVYNEEGGANKDYVYFGTEGTVEQMECQEEPCLPSNVDRMFKTVHTCPTPVGSVQYQCISDDWCVNYKNVATITIGDTAASDEIEMKFFASAPADPVDTTKFYTVSMMDKDCSDTVSHASIVTENPPAYGAGELSVKLNINTGVMNASPWLTSAAGADTLKAEFCVKVDLKATLDNVEYLVATDRVKMSLSVDLVKNFAEVTGFSTVAETNRDAGNKYITADYSLSACVCDQSNACITPDPILPGGEFTFCVSTSSTEVSLNDVRDIVFDNSAAGITIPIIKSDGSTFGPPNAVTKDCSSSICRITARTYAALYETSTLVDISGSNGIRGTGILAFVDSRSRRLGATTAFGSSSKIVTATTAVRGLQEDDAIPVNDFEMDMNLATPPDRSSAVSIAARGLGYASLMLGGMVGFAVF